MTSSSCSVQTVQVYRSRWFRVVLGANMGDAIAPMRDLVADDIYMLSPDASRERLSIDTDAAGRLSVAPGSEAGCAGATLHLDCAITLMARSGERAEALLLVELDSAGFIAETYLLSFTPLAAETGYALVAVDRAGAARLFAGSAMTSFARGTHITLGSGRQVRIEDLQVGDMVLTRDHGARPLRWIGQSTLRAVGALAPIRITAGALNNTNDLVLGPDHRLFVYQRDDHIGAGTPGLLLRARHLVNGTSVTVQPGGFVDYFQLLFDRHHLIYAEGIAAESLRIAPDIRAALPAALLDRLGPDPAGHGESAFHGFEVPETMLGAPESLERLRRASLI